MPKVRENLELSGIFVWISESDGVILIFSIPFYSALLIYNLNDLIAYLIFFCHLETWVMCLSTYIRFKEVILLWWISCFFCWCLYLIRLATNSVLCCFMNLFDFWILYYFYFMNNPVHFLLLFNFLFTLYVECSSSLTNCCDCYLRCI